MDVISTESAPAAIGPYSQAVKAGAYLFCSGQIGLDPETGKLAGDDVATQTRQVLANMGAVLSAAGLGYRDVVKTTIYLVDMGEFAEVNRLYGECFGDIKPARATVAVAALPLGARIEIECVAYRP